MGHWRRHRRAAADPVGKYQGEVAAANILGEPREANYQAIPDAYTDPQAASVGATEAPLSATIPLSEVAKTATYTHAYAQSKGFLTLLSDGEADRCLRPGARGRRVAPASHAGHPGQGAPRRAADTIQPFPTFSEIYVATLKALREQIPAAATGRLP